MRQLVILSGKGGTGKTSVAAAFAHLAYEGPSKVDAVLADADVDAANLGIVLHPTGSEKHEFIGGSVAQIDSGICSECGLCAEVCRFEAILTTPRHGVDPAGCEGCAACAYQCPEEAIHMEPQLAGHWFRSQSRYGPLFHAELFPGKENSGKLVTLVKQWARLHALDHGSEIMIVDGPPGIGCPVIAAASGADLLLIVAEPTQAGIHDMDRALGTAAHFRIAAAVCINKTDVFPEGAKQIADHCCARAVEVLGRIPFDPTVTDAMVQGQPVTAYRPQAPASQAIVAMWKRVTSSLELS